MKIEWIESENPRKYWKWITILILAIVYETISNWSMFIYPR